MTEKKQTDIFQQRGKETLIWYNFKHELPIKLEAIRELQSEDVKLKELEKIHNEFAEYVTNWYELFGIKNDPDITKTFKPTELLKEKGMNYFREKRLEFPKMLYPIEREIEKLRFKISIQNNQINSTPATSSKTEPPGAGENTEPFNQNTRIFPNGKCWQLFEHWRKDVKERTQLAEFSFIFWQMQKDGLIHEYIKPTEFRNWLHNTFEIELEPLKQLSNCDGGNKYSRYQSAKLLYQC